MKIQKKKGKKLVIVLAAIVVVLVAIAIGLSGRGKQEENGETNAEDISIEAQENSEDMGAEGENKGAENGEEGLTDRNGGTGTADGNGGGQSSVQGNADGSSENADGEAQNTISFPYTVQNSSLVIRKVQSYTGSFVEDGSNEKKTDITAMLVTNKGKTCVEYADLSLVYEGGTHEFAVSALEPGASCIVLEKNAQSYKKCGYTSCSAQIATLDNMEMSENLVEVKESGDGNLTVKNISNKKFATVRVFYKNYSKDDKVYVGGITYTAKAENLEPGFSQLITPSHYVKGQSKIIMVRTYEN